MAEIIFKELTQKMVEEYERHLGPRDSRAALSNGAVVRAALKADWFINPPYKTEDLCGLKPVVINTLARKVAREYDRVMVFDPE